MTSLAAACNAVAAQYPEAVGIVVVVISRNDDRPTLTIDTGVAVNQSSGLTRDHITTLATEALATEALAPETLQ